MRGVDWLGEDLLLLALDAGRGQSPCRDPSGLCAPPLTLLWFQSRRYTFCARGGPGEVLPVMLDVSACRGRGSPTIPVVQDGGVLALMSKGCLRGSQKL